jgi:methanogenic corrinoid protein MtbC1
MRQVLAPRFFTALVSGDRPTARQVVDELLDAETSAEQILAELFWPTLEQIQSFHRSDQLSDLAHHYATRLLRTLVDQMQLRLQTSEPRHRTVMLVCGPDEPEELAAQMAADLLEANGFTVHFAGGGVANDEIVSQLGGLNADVLCVFAALPSTVPFTRLLIDRLHDVGVCPKLQIAVGGGVFNRAEGLAEEIGADVWARTPHELVTVLSEQPQRRMGDNQRTVGRRRRTQAVAAA